MPIKVLIADDQPLVRAGLRAILETEDGMEVVGEAGDGAEAAAKAPRLGADVVLMDIRMPGVDGLEATRRLADGPRVVVLTTFDSDEYVFEAMRAGAAGFLLKDAAPERIIEAIRVAHAGEALLAPAVTRRIIEDYAARPAATQPPEAFRDLTDREAEVFALIARGETNREIAARLVVSEATVKTHVGRILMKLGFRDRVQTVIAAYEWGVVRPGEA
jgi:DNA-binding NarL/FixJ family response regulator